MKIKQWRSLHRLSGFIVVGFLLFYTFSGILLNHRKYFNNFLVEKQVPVSGRRVDPGLLRTFVEQCQAACGETRRPVMIVIRDMKNIDFRYDRHGYDSYLINPAAGTVRRVSKTAREPWHLMKWLHVNYMTTPAWVVISDLIALLILVNGISGLFCLRWRRREWLWALAGLAVFVIAVAVG
ncbi:MAG: hypothetical protein GXO34_00100 [Deltaproteobacteria bacterium]|nr:hypothetical protein [Deltaproteobacteria bacterium]